MCTPHRIVFLLLIIVFSSNSVAGAGKLQETAGVTQIEGSGGGGLVPWATLAGYDSRDEWASGVFLTRVSLDDYRLQAFGASASIYDRVEVSIARHTFELKSLPFGEREINQQIFGVKVKLAGDVIYTPWPQISAGIQYKDVQDDFIATAAGAQSPSNGTDVYIAATKAHLGALMGYNLVWNLTARATKANQFGLLGFGGDKNNHYNIMAEGSLAILLNRSLAIGVEYRQKPDNLSFAKEEDAYDIFVAYIPNKFFNITGAWANMGAIAGAEDQSGPYVSVTGYLW